MILDADQPVWAKHAGEDPADFEKRANVGPAWRRRSRGANLFNSGRCRFRRRIRDLERVDYRGDVEKQMSGFCKEASLGVTAGTDYDYIVVGSGITGLTVSRVLSQHGARVLLLEKAATLGGSASRFP